MLQLAQGECYVMVWSVAELEKIIRHLLFVGFLKSFFRILLWWWWIHILLLVVMVLHICPSLFLWFFCRHFKCNVTTQLLIYLETVTYLLPKSSFSLQQLFVNLPNYCLIPPNNNYLFILLNIVLFLLWTILCLSL